MRPIAELDPHVAEGIIGVAFDVDDTVTAGGRLEDSAFAAMWALRRAGLRLIAVTGRPLGWADVMARHWPIDAAVGENGAGWSWSDGKNFQEGYWEAAAERAGHRQRLEGLMAEVSVTLPDVRLASDQPARRCDVAFDVAERERVSAETLAALRTIVEAHGATMLVSSVHAHVFFGAWDKASGLVRCAGEVLGRDVAAERERWLYVGDSGNDAACFAYFPVSAGVANVREHLSRLPVPPTFVADDARGAGFAAIARTLLLRRGAAT